MGGGPLPGNPGWQVDSKTGMKICSSCGASQPDEARYCMRCGRSLPEPMPHVGSRRHGGWNLLALSLGASLLLSVVLMFVFHLPILFLAGFLPLLWLGKGKT